MVGSSPHHHRDHERSLENEPQEENNTPHHHQRLCDFCGESKALLYCRADSAKLCFNCDREVHSTNPLFTKHTRSQLCDFCDSNPASILCSTENLVLCQNCDWESHGKSSSSAHDRRSLEGFTGCPSGVELCSILGVEDVGVKSFSSSDEGFEDFLVWETPPILSIEDLVDSTDSTQNFQAMGNPPLPKNRKTACGKHKEEILSQLRDMMKLENCFVDDQLDLESLLGFQPSLPELNDEPRMNDLGFKHNAEPIVYPVYEKIESKWDCYTNDTPLSSAFKGSHAEEYSLVPNKSFDMVDNGVEANCSHENQSSQLVPREPPKVVLHKSVMQNRDSSLLRYKEKKKTRRYDHHIRYESRKARAEGRSRIRGRFAKVEQ